MSGENRTARHAGLVALAVCTGVWLVGTGLGAREEPPLPAAAESFARTDTTESGTTTSTAPLGADGRPAGIRALPASPPLRIRIPSIRVDAPLIGLGLRPDGGLEVPPPERRGMAGWYRDGTPPGAPGTAVVAGHVDAAKGRAVFYDLGALRRGASVEVVRGDGRTAVFTVHAVELYDAKRFPDRKVYGPSAGAELRVITCGGPFSKRTGYQGNVVVFAHLTATY
ncbi:class F sortase [Streptomyces sp. NPDC097619]|uniref:class F sortase n=1 Tax=Streptomyces sp. NPDC097619 TaxID=3157228 RepID=UPI0033313DFF